MQSINVKCIEKEGKKLSKPLNQIKMSSISKCLKWNTQLFFLPDEDPKASIDWSLNADNWMYCQLQIMVLKSLG